MTEEFSNLPEEYEKMKNHYEKILEKVYKQYLIYTQINVIKTYYEKYTNIGMTFIKSLNNLADEYNDSKDNKNAQTNDAFTSMLYKQIEFENLITNCFNNSFMEIEETIVNPTRSFYENIK